ncbi:BON domain-containing protein [Massilia sp. RP-1-19]|uniref:BON domain-containing protein n=1 Tax=Massilia polaris TaxID=2728846 RepID=A0A848HFR3_9BURK|nr:BON domain-containing protein [Massilia polaris]NML60295.1 BON domain-containing protein [Massilia polaris]
MTLARRFSAFLSALMILTLLGCAPTEKRVGTGQYIDDTVITAKVKGALVADPELKATEIQVDTYKGTVQLSGFVAVPEHVQKAERLVRDIEGVKSVKNAIAIKK